MALIHLLDGQTDEILEDFDSDKGEFFSVIRTHNLDNVDMVDLVFNSKLEKSALLTDAARLIIPIEDGKLMEYVISRVEDRRDGKIDVYAEASYLDLQTGKVSRPTGVREVE